MSILPGYSRLRGRRERAEVSSRQSFSNILNSIYRSSGENKRKITIQDYLALILLPGRKANLMQYFQCEDCTDNFESKEALERHLTSEWHDIKKEIISLKREAEEIQKRNKERGAYNMGFKQALGMLEVGMDLENVRKITVPYIRSFKEAAPWTVSERQDADHIVDMAYKMYQLEESSKSLKKY